MSKTWKGKKKRARWLRIFFQPFFNSYTKHTSMDKQPQTPAPLTKASSLWNTEQLYTAIHRTQPRPSSLLSAWTEEFESTEQAKQISWWRQSPTALSLLQRQPGVTAHSAIILDNSRRSGKRCWEASRWCDSCLDRRPECRQTTVCLRDRTAERTQLQEQQKD